MVIGTDIEFVAMIAVVKPLDVFCFAVLVVRGVLFPLIHGSVQLSHDGLDAAI